MRVKDRPRTFRTTPTEPPQLWVCVDEEEANELIAGIVPLRVMEEVAAMVDWSLSDPTPGRHTLPRESV